MRTRFTGLLLAAAGGYAVCSGVLAAALAYYKPDRGVVVFSIAFMLSVALLTTGFLLALRRRMIGILVALSSFVQDLSNGSVQQAAQSHEDSLTSKLQSQILELSRRLDAQRERYMKESREIKSLISDISHQLKTPMANLGMYAGLLQDDELPEEKRREFTQHVAGQTDKLGWLTDSLIKLSRLETGIIELRRDQLLPLGNTVLAAIKQVYPQVEAKGMELRLEGHKTILLRHDPRWTTEAIYNLLDNAVKYTEAPGQIVITLRQYDLFARVDVQDSGCGIGSDELASVFQRFYRGVNARDTQGVGIGLYLARKIIAGQGGYIKVSSEPGKGSCFSVFLPLQ